MSDDKKPLSTVEVIRRRKNELLQVLQSAAAQSGTIGNAVDAQILIPVTCALAQWEIALQLALRNQRDGIGVEPIGTPSQDPPKGKA